MSKLTKDTNLLVEKTPGPGVIIYLFSHIKQIELVKKPLTSKTIDN